jgi:hypothetical protein
MAFEIESIEIEDIQTEPKVEKKDEKKVIVKKPKKPKYSKTRYARLPPTKVLNKFIVNNVNERFLKEKKTKLTVSECEIGEASMYLVEYYTAIDPYHPALVIMGAVMGLGLRVMELQGGPDA